MKLIDILVQELPKRGGWPDGAGHIATNGYRRVFAYWVGSSLKGRDLNIVSDTEGYVRREQYEAALAASKTEWDGEGIPPVGTVCEYTKQSLTVKEWTECTIDYAGSSFIVYRDCYGVELTGIKGDIKFRPIRSEADKKKEDVEKSIADALFRDGDFAYVEALRLSTFIYGAISRNEIPHIRID